MKPPASFCNLEHTLSNWQLKPEAPMVSSPLLLGIQLVERKQVRLGCNEGWRKGCSQYFLLVGADSPEDRCSVRFPINQQHPGNPFPFPESSLRGQELVYSTLPPPVGSPIPRGLLPDSDTEAGGNGLPSPVWVLRLHAVAGGKGSLAQAVRALVDERRRSRAKNRNKLLPGAGFVLLFPLCAAVLRYRPFFFHLYTTCMRQMHHSSSRIEGFFLFLFLFLSNLSCAHFFQ